MTRLDEVMAKVRGLVSRIFRRECRHRFYIDHLRLTGLDDYHRRVCWPCMKCGQEFYAQCGLDIAHDGNITREAIAKQEGV